MIVLNKNKNQTYIQSVLFYLKSDWTPSENRDVLMP